MRLVLSVVLALLVLNGSAFGWGCEGHQMVALIARAHLTPSVSKAVDQLLRENPIDPSLNRFCKERPSDLMADSATWADDSRNIEKTGDWHFIDIPIAVHLDQIHDQDVSKWCKPTADGQPGCIVSAIEYQKGILTDRRQPPAARAKALRYLIHFAGDLSQPLHASDNRDRGGNCTEIRFLSQEKPENLHAIWDYKIIANALATDHATEVQYAKALDTDFARDRSPEVNVLAWTWESHAVAVTTTYPGLKPPIPIAAATAGLADQAACDAEKQLVAGLHVSVDNEYAIHALPVIREQLAKAGYHLAALLNQTLK